MDDGGIVGLEHQELTPPGFGAVHDEIVETDPLRDAGQRRCMAARESRIKSAEEGFFLKALGRALRHAGVEIPDVPAIGDRHVTGVGPAIDEYEPVLAKQAIVVSVVDESRDEEVLLLPLSEIALKRDAIVDLRKPPARMR